MKNIVYSYSTLSFFYLSSLLITPCSFAQENNEVRFSCQNIKGVYSTVAIIDNDENNPKIIIKWVSNALAGYPPQKRCNEVSQNFQVYHEMKQLNYVTTGVINRQNVICVAKNKGLDCNRSLPKQGLIFTLKPGQSKEKTLKALIDNQDGEGESLSETKGRTYVDLRKKIYGVSSVSSKPVEEQQKIPETGSSTVVSPSRTNNKKPCLLGCGN
jgi:Circadian oscillating protein COP23